MKGSYFDNYSAHPNGRIWICWDTSKVDLKLMNCSSQHIHCGVHALNGDFLFWLTGIYAHNQLDLRKRLWKNILGIYSKQTGPWCVIGDFNNVLGAQDRIGGKLVHGNEYIDLEQMMQDTQLSEMDSVGDYFTWSNKQVAGTIYSRIDRAICNVEWFLKYNNHSLNILPPNLSDHALLYIKGPQEMQRNNCFKFNNYLLEIVGFQDMAKKSWEKAVKGNPMQALWKKLKRLKYVVKEFSKTAGNMQTKINETRNKLHDAHISLMLNRNDGCLLESIKGLSADLIKYHEYEVARLAQRTKINWIRGGDENSKFFFAYLKARQNKNSINFLQLENGDIIEDQKGIEREVMRFYGSLMGDCSMNIKHIDVEAMREG
ncbi:uncharacterized protein LOC131651247 [Vicia villosa]|uniref:uncharacterized protein LOC131651247 n=1 Tax=Vicia villosa TaxID=3911 RepID=UPI00273C6562|nr:uncharacterized protein LOC131651247 [Vicia villosa]